MILNLYSNDYAKEDVQKWIRKQETSQKNGIFITSSKNERNIRNFYKKRK